MKSTPSQSAKVLFTCLAVAAFFTLSLRAARAQELYVEGTTTNSTFNSDRAEFNGLVYTAPPIFSGTTVGGVATFDQPNNNFGTLTFIPAGFTGTAEGIVAGKRQSLPITLTPVDRADAVYGIQQQWPQDGAWVLHLKGSCSNPKAEASTLAAVTKGTFIREKSEVLREPATKKQVEDAIAALARSQS